MKTFKVKEKYIVTGWTYIEAETREDAEEKLERDFSHKFKEEDTKHEETYWKTFQEVTK